VLRAPPGAQPSRLHAATRTPTPGFANPGSVDTQSRSNSAHHRRATAQLTQRLASAAVRQPPAPLTTLAGVETGASCPCPLSAAPRAFLPFTPGSPERAPSAGPRRRFCVEPSTSPAPHEAGRRAHPCGRAPVPRFRVDRSAASSRPSRHLDPTLADRACGGPSCCQGGRLSWAFVPRRFNSLVRVTGSVRLTHASGRSPTRASPQARRPVTGTPATPIATACAAADAVLRSPEPGELSPVGVSLELLRFGDRAR